MFSTDKKLLLSKTMQYRSLARYNISDDGLIELLRSNLGADWGKCSKG